MGLRSGSRLTFLESGYTVDAGRAVDLSGSPTPLPTPGNESISPTASCQFPKGDGKSSPRTTTTLAIRAAKNAQRSAPETDGRPETGNRHDNDFQFEVLTWTSKDESREEFRWTTIRVRTG